MHGDSARVYAEGQGGDRAERDNGARGRCRAPGQSAITVHWDGVRVHGKVQEGTGAERDNGARACTGRCRGRGQRAITVHGTVLHGKVQEGDRGRAR